MSKLTSRTLATGATLNDFIHIVITGDTSQSAQGSSYKASLSQLVPLFGGSPDVFLTGGTSNSTGGTMTFTNTTGGTFTVTGTTTPFTGGSGNCITSFYTNNIHACTDEITVHNRVQSTGSDAQSILSFAFGGNVQALERYTHAEGLYTIASGTTSHSEGSGTTSFGSYSHSEGIATKTGTNLAYLATGLTSGVVYLSSAYGNVFSNFTAGEYMLIDDTNYGGFIQDSYVVSAATFNIGTNQTTVYLNDTSLTTAGTGFVLVGDTNSPSLWGGNMVMGGYGANSKGSLTNAIGNYTLSLGDSTSAIGNNSFASGKGTVAGGLHSFSTGLNSKAYGVGSFVGGEGTITKGVNAFAIGRGTIAIGDQSFSHGYQTESRGDRTVTIGGQLNIVDSGTTENSGIFGGESNQITPIYPSDPVVNSAIIGGVGNRVKGFNSAIISSEDSIMLSNYSVILGGSGITGTNLNTVYVPKLVLYSAYTYTPSGTTDNTVDEVGSVTWDNNYFYYRDNIGWKRLSGATW
jgi:hypothetical protein